MYIVDDPMLALIARFVCVDKYRGVSEQEFLQLQVDAIESYVQSFPERERDARALKWVGQYAEQFRRNWQRKYLVRWLEELRCQDCPLADGHSMRHCKIHNQWSDLLTRYAAEKISSREFVEQNLKLLSENKEILKQKMPVQAGEN